MKQQIYQFDEFQLDAANRELRRDGKRVQLPAKALDLLQTLVENNGRLVGKDEIFNRVWHDQIVEESNLTVHISQIRKALGETKNNPRFITTVPGYGYRFSGEVQNLEQGDLVIEKHTLARIVIEKESDDASEEKSAPGLIAQNNEPKTVNQKSLTIPRTETAKHSRMKYIVATAAASLICLVLAFGFYRYFNGNKRGASFEKVKFTRLTNNGKVTGATISSNGKYVAYVLGETEGNSLWVRQVGTASDVRILPPTKAEFWSVRFSPDGAFIYYNLFAGDKTDVELFRIPFLGGVVEKIPNVVAKGIAFAPDGKRIAYIKPDSANNFNYLAIADANGGNERIIAAKKHPNTFQFEVSPAWSPDGETIACLVDRFESDANYSSIVGVNIKDGTEKSLSERRWYDVFGIEWIRNDNGLLISAKDKLSGGNQIWFLPYPQGEPRRITNDLNHYGWLSVTADGESFAAVQTNTTNSIWVGEAESGAETFKEIASEVGELHPLHWTPDGRIVFRSNKDGVSNLWTMDADGGNRRQLTTNAQVDSRGMCVSPDGKYIVFASWRSGKSNLWRVDAADGGNLTRLTDGEADSYPRCSPDNRTVIYQKGIYAKPTLWKVPLTGGESAPLTDFRAKWAAISTDANRVSYLQMADNKWRMGVISVEGSAMQQRVDVPADLAESTIYWSLDNQALFYIAAVGSVGNIKSLPLNGSPAKPLTNFTSHLLADFSLSPDGKRLAVTRTLSLSDVVLIENATLP